MKEKGQCENRETGQKVTTTSIKQEQIAMKREQRASKESQNGKLDVRTESSIQ
jgi:hypothetical protein